MFSSIGRKYQETALIKLIAIGLVLGIIVTTFLFALFFHINYAENLTQTVLAFFIVLIMSFLLSVVGISSIAYTGNEPVSGMTIFMIIVAALILTSRSA